MIAFLLAVTPVPLPSFTPPPVVLDQGQRLRKFPVVVKKKKKVVKK